MSTKPLHLAMLAGCVAALPSVALAQGSQIDTQRPVGDWLVDYTGSTPPDPKFWVWLTGGNVTSPDLSQHMKRWVHIGVNTPAANQRMYDQSTLLPIQANIDDMADAIYNEWMAIGCPTDYALFIHGWSWKSGILRHDDDELTHPSGGTWSETLDESRGSPWKNDGVALATDIWDDLITALEAKSGFVAPSRILHDEEESPVTSCLNRALNEKLEAIGNDSRRNSSTDPVVGNHELRTSTSNPILTDIFSSDFISWIEDDVDGTDNYLCPHESSNPYIPFHNGYVMNEYASLMRSVIDGTLHKAFIDGKAGHSDWDDTLISNYNTSTWYNYDYPAPGTGGFGVRKQGFNGSTYGWESRSSFGSGDAHAPVLYSADISHWTEDEDITVSCTQTAPSSCHVTDLCTLEDSHYDMWIRMNRVKLDHMLFTMNAESSAPDIAIPYLPRAGSLIGNTSLNQCTSTYSANASEDFARDVMALAKAKGIREGVLWGNETVAATANDDFNQTADIMDQVWNMNLSYVQRYNSETGVNPKYQTASELAPFLFSEEHTNDVLPGKRDDSQGSYPSWYMNPNAPGYITASTIKFTLSPRVDGSTDTYVYPNEVKLIMEFMDGGGPWDYGRNGEWEFSDFYKFRIRQFQYNYNSNNEYPDGTTDSNGASTINLHNVDASVLDTQGFKIREIYSTSTRTADFSTDTSNPLDIGAYSYSFDDENRGTTPVTNVIDRKTILEITIPYEFTLNSTTYNAYDFVHPTNFNTEVYYALLHEEELDSKNPNDAVLAHRVDMYQMYDSTPLSETQSTQVITIVAGDLNRDGIVDATDLDAFFAGLLDGNSTNAQDVNDDGAVDFRDLLIVLDAMRTDAD